MAKYGNCEISFLRGAWKPCSFHFLPVKVMVSVNRMQFVRFFFSFLHDFLGLLMEFFWGGGGGYGLLLFGGFFSQLLCPIKLDPFFDKIISIVDASTEKIFLWFAEASQI